MYIIGAGGHAKVIYSTLIKSGVNVEGFYDDNRRGTFLDKPVLNPVSSVSGSSPVILGIGDNQVRKKLADINPSLEFIKAIHPTARIDASSKIMEGTVVMASATINIDSIVGKHCIINTSSSIDHDCQIGDYVHISPNSTLCGNVSVGEGTQIGAGATILPGVKIGKWCTIGAGAVIIKDVPDGSVMVGIPGRNLKKEKKEVNIVGAGAFGSEVASILDICDFKLADFYDDSPMESVKAVENLPPGSRVLIALGDSKDRMSWQKRIGSGFTYESIVHPTAILQNKNSIEYGKGTIITAHCILTTNIRIGDFCVLNLNCTIGHDVVMEDYVSLMPSVNLGGNVYLEEAVYIGTGAVVLPGIRVGKNSIVGAGAVVTHNVPPNTTVKGVPAR